MGFSHTWRKGVEISTPFIFNRGASNLMYPISMIDILNYHQFDDGQHFSQIVRDSNRDFHETPAL